MHQNHSSKGPAFERIAIMVVLLTAFLLPIFVLPISWLPFQFSKNILVLVSVVVLVLGWLALRLKDGRISVPFSPLLLGFVSVPVVYIVSSLVSSSPGLSVVGQGTELDTAGFTFLCALLAFLTATYLKNKKAVFNVLLALLASFGVLVLFQGMRLIFGADFLSFGLFTSTVANLVGSWNDFGIFSAFIAILSLSMLEVVPARGPLSYVLYAGLVLGAFFVLIVNFSFLWWALALYALALVIYSFSYGRAFHMPGAAHGGFWSRISKPAFALLLVSVIMLGLGSSYITTSHPSVALGQRISNAFNLQYIEARPTWRSTWQVANSSLKQDALLGEGPNQFSRAWVMYKPTTVNDSDVFWSVDFSFGVGIIPSALITAGALGLLAWLLVLSGFLFEGYRSLRRPREDAFGYYLMFSSFTAGSFLWVAHVFYTPSNAIYALAFLMSGIFIASLVLEKIVTLKTFDFHGAPAKNFAGISLLAGVLIVLAGLTFLFGQRLLALAYFGHGLYSYNVKGNLVDAEISVRRALAVSADDIYYRALSDVALLDLNQLLQTQNNNSPETLREQFRVLVGGAVDAAQRAVTADPQNYLNYMSLGRVYETLLQVKVEGAYEQAALNYSKAGELNPTNPGIRLSQARLEVLKGDNAAAREFIRQSLELKRNYTDAIFLLSQIEVAEGNLKEAIASVESAALFAPNDPVVFFQLGFLYYNDKNYQKAAEALSRSVGLQPEYANAKYFLGLSLAELGQTEEAVSQFEYLTQTNPDNQDVKKILENLKAGKDAFAGVSAPNDKPETLPNLPVKETKSKATSNEEEGL